MAWQSRLAELVARKPVAGVKCRPGVYHPESPDGYHLESANGYHLESAGLYHRK
jgi:hypothetical protein